MKVILTQPGTQHSLRLAKELERIGLLETFWTGFVCRADSRLCTLLQSVIPFAAMRRRLSNRMLANVPWSKVHCMVGGEIWAQLWKLAGFEEQLVLHGRNAGFQFKIPDAALVNGDAVIGFDTASWILVKRCRALGTPFFLDQTVAHAMARELVYGGLKKRYPEWSGTYASRLPEVLAAEREEHVLADRIVVASAFTRRTLIEHGVDGAKIRVNPYGVDLDRFHIADRDATDRPLRFVFVGALQARKGIPVLIEAWSRLASRDAELWLVGPVAAGVRRIIPHLPGLFVRGPIPNCEMPRVLSTCDVFVFPSLFEGFGLVILEAMASGLPAITTDATAGPDVLAEGRDGFVIPAGDVDALEAKMRWCIENRDRLAAMGAAERATAERFTWGAYGDRWKGMLEDVHGHGRPMEG